MMLPHDLRRALDHVFEGVSLRDAARSADGLRQRYRDQVGAGFVESDADALSYVGGRYPGTYAAARAVFEELRLRDPELSPRTLLDVGAGPGGAAAAAVAVFPELESITLLEGDPKMIRVGKRIMAQLDAEALRSAQYRTVDVRSEWSAEPHDLVVASYMLREIPERARPALVDRLWQHTAGALCCVEPGKSPVGYEVVRAARDRLADAGAHMLAPCRELRGCGTRSGSWCHFAQRVERSSVQRRLKHGSRSYEDEKYSYLIASRQAAAPDGARVAVPPRRSGAGVYLELCTGEQRQIVLVRKRDRELYAWARRAAWGDVVPPELHLIDGEGGVGRERDEGGVGKDGERP